MPNFIKSKDFICKYCGSKATTGSSLTSSRCSKSPTGRHVVYEGDTNIYINGCDKKIVKKEFVCQHCGYKASSISSLTGTKCFKNSGDGTKYHVPS